MKLKIKFRIRTKTISGRKNRTQDPVNQASKKSYVFSYETGWIKWTKFYTNIPTPDTFSVSQNIISEAIKTIELLTYACVKVRRLSAAPIQGWMRHLQPHVASAFRVFNV